MLDTAAITAKAPEETVGAAIARLTGCFAAAGLDTPALDARLLLMHACGLRHEDIILDPHRPLSRAEQSAAAAYAERRLGREPVARILGEREFWGRAFALSPATLDPRPDSEALIETALDLLIRENRRDEPLRLLDLGTGTGCLLISLACELPRATGIGVDLNPAALAVARANAVRHGVAQRTAFLRSDWFDEVTGCFDLIIANPPYIASQELAALAPEVSRYDPIPALDGGTDGLAAYRAISARLASVLAPGGWVALEVGAGQAPAVGALLNADAHGCWSDAATGLDLAGIARVVARKKQLGAEFELSKKTVGKAR